MMMNRQRREVEWFNAWILLRIGVLWYILLFPNFVYCFFPLQMGAFLGGDAWLWCLNYFFFKMLPLRRVFDTKMSIGLKISS